MDNCKILIETFKRKRPCGARVEVLSVPPLTKQKQIEITKLVKLTEYEKNGLAENALSDRNIIIHNHYNVVKRAVANKSKQKKRAPVKKRKNARK